MGKTKPGFSVLDHDLVPKHEIVPDSEVDSIIKALNLDSASKLPKISVDDPVVKEIGAKRGDIVRIYRKDYIGEYVYYRIVV
ncbi:MAG: DNA-directed RNA polymerase subunit H [Candidatus Micrarchaeia archaeon]